MELKRTRIHRACVAAFAAGALGASSAVLAEEWAPDEDEYGQGGQQQQDQYGQQQEQHGQQQGWQQEQPSVDVGEQELDQFAEAFLAVQEIQTEISEELQAATDESEAQDLQRQAQEEMVSAVEDSGLSVEEYNQIAQLMNSDPEIRDGIMERINGGAQQW